MEASYARKFWFKGDQKRKKGHEQVHLMWFFPTRIKHMNLSDFKNFARKEINAKPCQQVQLYRIEEKLNLQFHNIHPTHYLPFLLCIENTNQKNSIFNNYTDSQRTKELQLNSRNWGHTHSKKQPFFSISGADQQSTSHSATKYTCTKIKTKGTHLTTNMQKCNE